MLVDAVKRHEKYPDTFQVPSTDEIKKLKIGDFAKLCFEDKERMWVKITHINGDKFKGILDNEPIVVEKKLGDIVQFKSKNIYSIIEV